MFQNGATTFSILAPSIATFGIVYLYADSCFSIIVILSVCKGATTLVITTLGIVPLSVFISVANVNERHES